MTIFRSMGGSPVIVKVALTRRIASELERPLAIPAPARALIGLPARLGAADTDAAG